MTQSFVQRAMKRKTPLLVIFRGGESDALKEQYEFAKKVAETNQHDISVLESDGQSHPGLLTQWGASGKKFPTAILVRFLERSVDIKAYDEEKEITVESVLSWAQSCTEGKGCPSFLKSDPVPESNDGPVTVVVGKTFESIVLDDSKDVVLEVYSPTCPHCKNIVKTYNELGERYAHEHSVVIATLDGTTNSLPENVEVRGYPTILLFKAGDKSNPIVFDKGERTLENFVQFIEENRGTFKISTDEKKPEEKQEKDEL